MEVIVVNNEVEEFDGNEIEGIIGDVVDLLNLGLDIDGIIYNDNWTVKRFLNGMRLTLHSRIAGIFSYLELDMKYLNVRIGDLSKTIFKYVLLAYILINNKKTVLFDYFDVGLTYKEQKKLIRIIRNLKRDGKKVFFISRDPVFLNRIADRLTVFKEEEMSYQGKISEWLEHEKIEEKPEILKFIELANEKQARLTKTLDSGELLKDIYRSVY